MLVQHIEILQQIIENLVHTVQVKSVDNTTADVSVLSVCNTYYLNNCDKFITIDGIQYKVTEFTINTSLTLVPQDDAKTQVDPSTTDFIIPAPRFYSGTPQATSLEKTTDEENGINGELIQGPVIWILEILNILPPEDINKSVVRSTMEGVNMFFLDDTKSEDWNTEEHRTIVINPQKNEWEFVFRGFQKLVGNFFGELEKGRTTELADFGKYIIDNGNKATILNERLSGIRVIWDIPFSFDPCDDCDNGLIELCPAVPLLVNSDSMGETVPGSTKILTVRDTDLNVVGARIDDDTWEVPVGGGGSVESLLNGVSYGSTVAPGSKDIAVHNTIDSDVGTKIDDDEIEIADADIEVFLNGISQGVISIPAEEDEVINFVWT